MLHIGFSTRHLQCDEAILRALLEDVNACLETIAMALDLLIEALHHLLQLMDHGADGGICRIGGFGVAVVMDGIWFDGSRSLIPDCLDRE
jgi:hypothetical protein